MAFQPKHVHPEGARYAPSNAHVFAAVEVRTIGAGVEKGVFAAEPIAADAVVAVDGGLVLDSIEDIPSDRRYAVLIGEGIYLAPPDYDNLDPVWYFNHSCRSNVARLGGLVYLAKTGIAVGEQLTLDYAPLVAGTPGWRMVCHCSSVSCRGAITGDDWKDPHLAGDLWREWLPSIQRQIIDRRGP